MQNNIVLLIDDQVERIKQKITKRLNWAWQDTYCCTNQNGFVILDFFHPTLLFHSGKHKKDGCFVWYRLEIGSSHYSEENLKKLLEQILNVIGLKPFMDQDAGVNGKIFVKQRKDMPGYFIVYCYVNPDFPEGYWENHTITI